MFLRFCLLCVNINNIYIQTVGICQNTFTMKQSPSLQITHLYIEFAFIYAIDYFTWHCIVLFLKPGMLSTVANVEQPLCVRRD